MGSVSDVNALGILSIVSFTSKYKHILPLNDKEETYKIK